MGEYIISVITPFHNVDYEMFNSCIDSMLKQTLGFENIEWIIALHNCDQDHIDYAKKKLSNFKNVILKEVNNESRTPSSPRNVGLDLATSEYVAFLDGDDKFREDALEKIIYYFKKSNSQILVFRREFELEHPDMLALSETVTWDTTREMIIVDMNDSVDNRNYNSFPFFVTNRAFKRDFLNENHIRFDEDIDNAEDCYFNLQTIHLADKMCFLPQLIGYTYFINSKSILSSDKSDEDILHMLRNSTRIIDDALDYGLYVNNIILALGFVMSRYLSVPSVKKETRTIVKETFEPYLKMTTPIPAGRFMEPFRTMMNILPFEILLNTKRFENQSTIQNDYDVLAGILKENENTHFGSRYHFEDILSIRGFQSQVPIESLESYQPMVDAEKSIGDINIYASKKPSWYTKLINGMYMPVSEKQAISYADAFQNVLKGNNILVFSETDTPIVRFNNGVLGSTISGITLDGYYRKYRYTLSELTRKFVIPREIYYQMDDKADTSPEFDLARRYLFTLMSVANKHVDQIIVFGATDFRKFEDSIYEFMPDLIEDIEAGKLHKDYGFNDAVKQYLALHLKRNQKRANELREIYSQKERISLRDIWKKLSDITLIDVQPTSNSIDEYSGIKIDKSMVICEEGMIGSRAEENGEYVLNRDNKFYEFINYQGDESHIILPDDLEPGQVVRPVVTSDAGLYRVPLRFKIKISGVEEGNIIFKDCV
ncbi:Glycosyl transferase family 2 [Pseudobutyrivibrio sp. AR14]|uniref:GH3 family domain-containing protein n=1 Tax=Pseudobutyrivibrio sp. AR14 TaxID=1520804 RepID=UPI000886B597|nr:GH3 auxin-responsive promoter family protein [Pseudobutyrivibrio sp. AR14]SCX86611.1 Glycosyl transferase family 2 [Pseudobutyrivibrio sp. AR14]